MEWGMNAFQVQLKPIHTHQSKFSNCILSKSKVKLLVMAELQHVMTNNTPQKQNTLLGLLFILHIRLQAY